MTTTSGPGAAIMDDNHLLTSSTARKGGDSSRDLRSPHPPPLPATRFAVHRPGIPEASPRMKGDGEVGGMPCRGFVPGCTGARLSLADSLKVSHRTDILEEMERRFLPSLKAGVSAPQS